MRGERYFQSTLHNFSYQYVGSKTPHLPTKIWSSSFINTLSCVGFFDCSNGMICVLHLILALTVGISPRVHAILPSGKIIEDISKQLDGKEVGDCDAILVSSPGEIDSQSCCTASEIYYAEHIAL